MKVKIGPYRNRWVSYIHDRHMDKKYGAFKWRESIDYEDYVLEAIEDGLQWIYNHTINLILDRMPGQKVKIRIDKYDTWSMDHTLAPIILPMLKQLKETKHGAPNVDMGDVPTELWPTTAQQKNYQRNGETDPKFFERWDWIMDEMIWAFGQKCRDDWESDYDYNKWDMEGLKAHQERMSNGFRLFGKYYENLWD